MLSRRIASVTGAALRRSVNARATAALTRAVNASCASSSASASAPAAAAAGAQRHMVAAAIAAAAKPRAFTTLSASALARGVAMPTAPMRAAAAAAAGSAAAARRGMASDADGGSGGLKTDTEDVVPIENYRNLAIIAHVDHGKTTLVDGLLRQSNTRIAATEERIMDSNALERERGITILAKNTSILWKDAADNNKTYRLNIVDTPGHADFGGEVERIMSMVDGVCLVVDAADGPMTQTKFVLGKALKRGLKPIVVVNKVDRPNSRVGNGVENEIFDLFIALEASDEQSEYKVVYASGREGFAYLDPKNPGDARVMTPLFKTIVQSVPAPVVNRDAPFSMLVTMIESNKFLGKCLLGRVQTGRVRAGQTLVALDPTGKKLEEVKVLKVLTRRGLDQVAVEEGGAGDIISLAGFQQATVNCTLCHPSVTAAIAATPIDPPTVSMAFSANTSPLMGKEGTKVTNSQIGDRLRAEAETNVSIRLFPSATGDAYEVHARGELQLGILIENMRREGFELSLSPPRVVYRKGANGAREEPMEEVQIDCDPTHSGAIIEKMALRKAEVKEYAQTSDGRSRLVFLAPTRGLLGFRNELNNLTQGSAVLNSTFHSYVPYKGTIEKQMHGAIISMDSGTCTAYALNELQSRGILFVTSGMSVYPGMVIGEHTREHDIEVNPVKTKQLTNVRSVIKQDKTHITPAKLMSLEEVIAYMRDDEVIEVTTTNIRLRKRFLSMEERKKWKREQEALNKDA